MTAGPFDPADGEVVVRLAAARAISGHVLLADGSPAAGVELTAFPTGESRSQYLCHGRAHSMEDGSFLIDGLGQSEYRLVAKVPAGAAVPPPITVATDRTDVLIRLATGRDVALTILDPDGRPVPEAWVSVRRGKEIWRSRADGGGIARLTNLPDAPSLKLTVEPVQGRLDLRPYTRTEWPPRDGEIRLPRGYVVSGIVRDAAGRPVARARVYYNPESRKYGHQCVRADAKGRFRIGRLEKPDVRLMPLPAEGKWRVDADARATWVNAKSGEVELTVIE